LPDDASVNVIVEHPRNENLLFLGNEVGVFVSIDRGDSWAQLKNNLPTVPVDDIVIHPRDNDLVLGTHGRGIWILHDITPLEEMSADILNADAHIFTARRTPMFRVTGWQEWSPGTWRVPNPAPGAMIHYYLKEDAPLPSPAAGAGRGGGGRLAAVGGGGGGGGRGGGGRFGGRGGGNQTPPPPPAAAPEPTVKLTVLDANGDFVRELEGPGRAGVQTASWDFRIADAYTPTAGGGGGGGRRGGRGGGGRRGPEVLPGTYTVRLEAGGRTVETTIEVVLDPRLQVSMDVLQARQDTMMDAYHLLEPVYDAQQALAAINAQLNDVRGLLGDDAPDGLSSEVSDITSDVRQIQERMEEAGAGGRALNPMQSFVGEPTADQLWQINQSWRMLPGVIEQINAVITDRIPGLIAMVYQPGVGPDPLEIVEIPTRPAR